MRRLRRWLALLPLLALGCASFMHLSDPGAQAATCAVTGAVLPAIEALAVTLGLPVAVVSALYGDACSDAAARGLSQAEAEREGLTKAKRRGLALKRSGVRFEGGK